MFQTSTILERFIVIEGVDGSGTSTQRTLLSEKFKSLGMVAHEEFEPTEGEIGKLIRRALEKKIKFTPSTLALLFAADRIEHHSGTNGIIEKSSLGEFVISDRYVFSSLAYQTIHNSLEWIESINLDVPLPEYLFFIDVDLSTSKNRRSLRGNEDELFDEDPIQIQVRKNYLESIKKIVEFHPMIKFKMIDGTKSIANIHHEICNSLGFTPIL